MARAARILLIAEPEERTTWLADALVGAGFESSFTIVSDAPAAIVALGRDGWELIVCSGHRTVLPDALGSGGASLRVDGIPFIFLAENYESVAELAIRFGARVCLQRLGLEHLGRAIQLAFAEGQRRQESHGAREFERAQRQVLEHMASGLGLSDVLTEIVRLVEARDEGLMCSILLLDSEGRVRHGAAPSLPPEFAASIDGLAIGPNAGSCGTAAYLKKRVVVEDIATHPYWAEYRHLALPFGLRGCWSSPICSAECEVLGTFAIYYRQPHTPTEREMTWVDRATHLAAIAIERDRTVEALRRSEARYRQIVDTAYEGVWLIDAESRTVFVNRRTTELLGYAAGEILGRSVFHFVHPDDRANVEARLRRRDEQTPEQMEVHFRRKDGSDFWALVASSTVHNERGEVVGGLGMITDITPLKHAATALQQSATEFRALFENAVIGMALVDEKGHLLRSNPALEKMLGYSADELAELTLAELSHAGDVDQGLVQGEQLHSGQSSYQVEQRYLRKDRGEVWGRLTASGLVQRAGMPPFRIAMIEDVTVRKQMEQRVGESERLRALVYNVVSDVLFYVGVEPDGDFRFLSVNSAFLKATGLSEDRVVNALVRQVIPMPAQSVVLENYRRAIREKRTVIWHEVSEYPTGTKHGEVSIAPIFDASGRCTNLVGTVHDVTEHVTAQERIQEQAALLDRAKDAIFVRDMSGAVTYWNRGAERLYGWGSRDAIGRPMQELMPGDASAFDYAQHALLDNGEWSGELAQSTREGKSITIEASWTLLRDDRGRPKAVFAIHSDISERRQLELQIARAQRLESLGTLAGGVAHDFANILGAITANVGLGLTQVEPQDPVHESLTEIERASTRGADLVRQILTFSRDRKPERKLIDVESVVVDVLKLLKSSVPSRVEVRTHFAGNLPEVFADPTQLHQVVMNLVTNAVQAMGDSGGVLSIAADRAPAADFVRLSVGDTGSGMDPTTLERIFEPFYTTKQWGKGTGLGLSVVHGIVKSHEGEIDVQSTPGHGTIITIDLPAAH